MWGFTLTILTILWLSLTAVTVWWMAHAQMGWTRWAWGLLICLIPGLGAMIWWTWGSDAPFPLPERWKSVPNESKPESDDPS